MKIKLLHDGGYGDMEDVKFPVEVEADEMAGYFSVNRSELYRVGAEAGAFELMRTWAFHKTICEVVE